MIGFKNFRPRVKCGSPGDWHNFDAAPAMVRAGGLRRRATTWALLMTPSHRHTMMMTRSL